MNTQTHSKVKPREVELEDMTMHDFLAMFFMTGLLAACVHPNEKAIRQAMSLADVFLKLRQENLNK
jgi:hypothetical protein